MKSAEPLDLMTAVDGLVRFYMDESALGLGKTLAAARKDVIHAGHPLIPECPVGTFDEVWMPAIAKRGLVVIGRDKRIRTLPVEIDAIRIHGLRVFRIGGKRDQSTWEWLARLVHNWSRMEQVIASRPVGPWFYLINENGLAEVKLDRPSAQRVVRASPTTGPQSKPTREPENPALTGLELG